MSGTLSPEERERLEELFDRAAELPAAERSGFVEAECGANEALRAELERLLAGLAGTDLLAQLQPVQPSRVGERIGPYELLEKIGEGGMGEVYLAEQRAPLARRVALKLIKPGMDSAQVVRRFEAERQTLALMAHPSIAQVYDGGATEDGRPYFVMEHVDGEPLTAHCDRRRLSTRARLELFLLVCDGVQHAHQKGVIHRDLKPSNLLVTEQAGRALPKIIDFGVARATTGRLAERTLQTRVGQIVGTLDYMSPEQADPTGLELDTRSDIYSLGVVLYQLLSGLLPFQHSSSAGLPLSEVQRAIREVDPPTPSTRLRRQTNTATTIAPLHGTSEHALIRQLAGDLDWICLKALEKDPARRYQSVHELADDVRRHLAHQPVLAGRPGALYRARKFVRRHRAAVTAGLLVVAAAAAGVVGVVSARIEAGASARVAEALRPQADAWRLEQLEAQADELWPPHPQLVPAMEAWVEGAQELLVPLDGYRAQRDALRARARDYTAADAARDRETHPDRSLLEARTAEYEFLLGEFERGLEGEDLAWVDARLLELEPELQALEAEGSRRRTWGFDDEQDVVEHALLSELVDGLERLAADLLDPDAITPEHGWSVARRLHFARTIGERSVTGPAAAARWEEAIASIADPDECPLYGGLVVRPQVGLLPIRRNPETTLWEFAHLMTGPPAERGSDGELVLAEDSGLVLILVPGGTFTMGAQSEDEGGPNYDPMSSNWPPEGPWPDVDVPAFFVSKYEMTQAQWVAATGSNPSLSQRSAVAHAPRNPVNQVSWTECDRVTRQLGLLLPGEEQWEYAARGGTTTPWWTGSDPEVARRAANLAGDLDGFHTVTRVGSFPPNPFGLFDVMGNVSEWCANHPHLYGTVPGIAPETLRERSGRGGNAREREALRLSRSANRLTARPDMNTPALGLRPARALDG